MGLTWLVARGWFPKAHTAIITSARIAKCVRNAPFGGAIAHVREETRPDSAADLRRAAAVENYRPTYRQYLLSKIDKRAHVASAHCIWSGESDLKQVLWAYELI